MTAEEFQQWLADMKMAGIARSDAAAGRLLGITSHGVLKRKKQGASIETALACNALLNGLDPYGNSPDP